jgi:tetratricopeptide (TPR) repeat protein
MKMVRIKIKTLIILLLTLAALLGTACFFTPQLLAAAARNYQSGDQQEAAMILNERLIRYFPQSAEARDEAFAIADQILAGEDRIMIGPSFTGGGVNKNIPVNAAKAISYLERVAAAQGENLWKYNGWTLIGRLYQRTGDYAQAERWFKLALAGYQNLDRNYDWKTAEVNGDLIELYLDTAAYAKAMSLIKAGIEQYTEPYELAKYYAWQGDVYYAQGDYLQAKPSYTKALAMEERNWQRGMDLQKEMAQQDNASTRNINSDLAQQPGYRYAKARLALLEAMQGNNRDIGAITGEILAGSLPLANVQVYLIREREYDGRASNLEGISSQLPVTTDAQGRFSFRDVPPDQYFLVLGFVPEDLAGLGKFNGLESFTVKAGETVNLRYALQPRVKILEPAGKTVFREGDQLKIAWDAVPDAASYNLNLTLKIENGYVSRAYKTGLRETSYVFAPRGLELREMNFVTWGDSSQLGPSAILGSFYPGAQIFFQVEAFNQDGRSISESEGYVLQPDENYPWIEITGVDHFSAGDQLVQEKKYTEALNAYKVDAARNPGDLYALLSLARLSNYSWSLTEKTDDPQQALLYYKQLLALTSEPFLSEESASAADAAGDYSLALQLFTSFENRMEPRSFWFQRLGELYFLTGQPEQAIRYYGQYLDGRGELTDLGPVMAMLYVDDLPAALDLLQTKTYSEKPRYAEGGQAERAADIRLITANLERYRNGVPSKLSRTEFKTYLSEIMHITGKNRFGQVKAFQEKVRAQGENDILVQTLQELARDRL